MAKERLLFIFSLMSALACGYSDSYSSRTGGFTVTTPQPVLTPVQSDPAQSTARFQYAITPWPPPCSVCRPNNPDYIPYRHVEFTFRKHVEGGGTRTLCFVRYIQGAFDVDTGQCNETEARMPPYEDINPTGMVFQLKDVTYDLDQGRYSLLIQYGSPDIVTPMDVDVQVMPGAITSAKEPNQTVYQIGDKVKMTCSITNTNPGATFYWTRGATETLVPVDEYVAESYEEESYSTIEVVLQKGDSGEYYKCTADNGVGNKPTYNFALTVAYPPEIKVNPCLQANMNYPIREGQTARFFCEIDANPTANNQTKWYKGPTGSFDTAQEILTDDAQTDLVVKDVDASSPDVYYWCQATNSLATTQNKCMLDVHYPPYIEIPDEVTRKEGESVDVTCSADANPAVETYQWKLVGDPESDFGEERLHLPNILPEQGRMYECVATNHMVDIGKYSARKSMEVNVLFSARPMQYSVWKFGSRTDEEVSMVCDLWAHPDLTFQWKKDNKAIGSNSDRTITNEGQRSVLTIHSVKSDDYGQYECSASNSQGTKAFQVDLLKPGKPGQPQDCFPTDIAANDVSLECILGYDGGETLTFYAERQDGGKRIKVDVTVSFPGHLTGVQVPNATVELHQLPPSTNHTLYIYQENSHGRSQEMLTIHVKTEAGNTIAPPIDRGPSVGAVIGVAFGTLVLIGSLVAVAIFVFWKYGDSGCTSNQALKYSTVAKDAEGQENMAFNRDSSVPNEYVMVPGMTKTQPREGQGEGARSRESRPVSYLSTTGEGARSRDSRPQSYHDAVRLREGQSNLAGMGALSHNSTRNLNAAAGNQREVQPQQGARPKRMAPTDPKWEFPRSNLKIQQRLGEGAYGEVWKGTARNLGGEPSTVVAIKFLRDNTPREEYESLRRELDVMKQLKPHPNVISLLGCCSTEEPLYIIMEYAGWGNLQQYLRSNRSTQQPDRYTGPESVTLTSRDLTVFALHVACGMEYIADKEFLHRDLAARNVLVDDSLTCKIGDFGLARDIINTRQYESKTQRRLPIRWMAPESLFDSIYSPKSDVWSFGVLLWEVVTLGSTPYPGLSGQDIMELLRTGYRMDKPRLCSPNMYSLMQDCWNDAPRQRPSFPLLRKQLENHLWELERHSASILTVQQMRDNMFAILLNQPGEKC